MAFWEAGLGGSFGGRFRIRVNVDLVGQEAGNNRSLIRYSAWLERTDGSGGRIWHYDPIYGNTNINGYNPGRSIGGYDSSSAGQRWYMAQNEQYWIGHDGNGNANPYFGANIDAANSPYLTSGATGGNYGLPTINRFATITQFYVFNVTDVGFSIHTSVSDLCNFLQYSLEDGVGWRDQFGGNFYDYDFALGGAFPSDKDYNLRVRVRRADSGLWSESGVISTKTLKQGGFFDLMGL